MKVVLAHGVFDLLHSGHIAHLMQCRSFGDYLLVSVMADKFVEKGRELIDDEKDRMFTVSALRCVDEVILCNGTGPMQILHNRKPYIYVRNDEYLAQDKPEYRVCKDLGIRVGFTKTVGPHTSTKVERIRTREPRK